MKLLTILEACERLRISRATLYKLVRRGKLRVTKVGGKSLITEDALQSLLGAGSPGRRVGGEAWEQYYETLLHLGLTIPGSRQAIVAPTFEDFAPVEAAGKPASELIIEERGAR